MLTAYHYFNYITESIDRQTGRQLLTHTPPFPFPFPPLSPSTTHTCTHPTPSTLIYSILPLLLTSLLLLLFYSLPLSNHNPKRHILAYCSPSLHLYHNVLILRTYSPFLHHIPPLQRHSFYPLHPRSKASDSLLTLTPSPQQHKGKILSLIQLHTPSFAPFVHSFASPLLPIHANTRE